MRTFAELSDEYIDRSIEESPIGATSLGVHDRDGDLNDYGAEARKRRKADLKRWLAELGSLNGQDRWQNYERHEADILRRRLRWELYGLDEYRQYAINPTLYGNAIGSALLSLMIRDFAPKEERAKSAASRIAQIPRLLEQGTSEP